MIGSHVLTDLEGRMLGQHKLLERHLRKSGKSAIATVLEAKQTHWAVGSGNPNLVANNNIVWKLSSGSGLTVSRRSRRQRTRRSGS